MTLVCVVVAWRVDLHAIRLNRSYRSAWKTAVRKYQVEAREHEAAKQQLAFRNTAVMNRLYPLLRQLEQLPPEERFGHLESVSDQIQLDIINAVNDGKDSTELIVYRNAVALLKKGFGEQRLR